MIFPSSRVQKIFVGFLSLFLLLGLVYGIRQNMLPPPTNSLKTASFVDRTGKVYTFESFKGKPLVVNIWASWCGPCVAEMPTLDQLAFKMRAHGGDVLTILVEPLIGKGIASFARQNIRYLTPYHDFQGEVSNAPHM